MATAIWWIRRDVRVYDNTALMTAIDRGFQIVPLFILDPHLLAAAGEKRKGFLFSGLRRLDESLHTYGSRLVVRAGRPMDELLKLVAETQAEEVFAEADFTPYARRRDNLIAGRMRFTLTGGLTVHHPDALLKPDGTPYVVFTPFSKAWKAFPFNRGFDQLPAIPFPPIQVESVPLPGMKEVEGFPAGEAEALRRLEDFTQNAIFFYQEDRNRMDLAGTSSLSPYLRFGMLSARRAVQAALAAREAAQTELERRGAETWLNELIWREFYQSILYHFPHVLQTAFNPSLRNIPWRDVPDHLLAWQEGLTGYPVVDAAMRQLRQTGWMHNRARMITASFLTKDLLINWQEGEKWFMCNLVDGDPAANNGGWQWTAGVGTDAAPYFRIFNPVLQGKKFDPQGDTIRRWMPELQDLPEEWIHTPWLMPEDAQRRYGFTPGRHYPLPVVDHAAVRDRTLEAYQFSKNKS